MLPNTGHCATGPGGAEIDWITAIENWVEKGQAPDALTVYHLKQPGYLPRPRHPLRPEEYDRTRAIYPYPAVAKYSGKGDPNVAASWVRSSGK
jgi:feruloyl esterase